MRISNNAEIWKIAYEAFQQVNFAAWDFNTIKQSLLDYLKIYYTEDFSDYIESSEFIALLEIFAYLGELMAYRTDLNAQENFISTANRKESVLRLANLLSYNASRNIPARGLVKLTSCSTTERVFDSRGTELTNKTIYWNDPNNSNWKEQFILIMNKIITQEFGTVLSSDRVQVDDVLYELYVLNNTPLPTQVIKFSTSVSDTNYPMEIVAVKLDPLFGPYEQRPEINQNISIMYLSDGLGDSSENSGFFYFIKQGTLTKTSTTFDGITPNQYYDINVQNCNETDIWVNNVDSVTDIIIVGDDINGVRDGEWQEVDIADAQNVLFNTNPYTNKYELSTLDNDAFRIIFGDGNFAAIPSGTFDIWYRVSANTDVIIPTTAIQNTGIAITYTGVDGSEQIFHTTISLTAPIQNAAPSETIDNIRRIAPAVYFTQDRMVNGRDYNEFMLQDNTILKLRAINRTFAGDSKYLAWHDPTGYYENVKIFGDDLVLYFNTYQYVLMASASDLPADDGGANFNLISAVINNYMEAILQSEPYFINSILYGVNPLNIRKIFNTIETAAIQVALVNIINSPPGTFYLVFSPSTQSWTIAPTEPDVWDMSISISSDGNWIFVYNGKKIIAHSDTTNFWLSNPNQKITTYDTLNPNYDNIVLLKANPSSTGGILTANYPFIVLGQDIITQGATIGSPSRHDFNIIPSDSDGDGFPDNVSLSYLINLATDFVYFNRIGTNSPWVFIPYSAKTLASYNADTLGLWKRENGKEGLNFAWFHRTSNYHLIDPAPSNIIDSYIIQRGYYLLNRLWLANKIDTSPIAPTPQELNADYSSMLNNKMISDALILHPGKIKVIIGSKASSELQAKIKVVVSAFKTLTTNQIKAQIVTLVNNYFDITLWEFGETFYFSELATYIHTNLSTEIDAIVIVPLTLGQVYGDLQQIMANDDEIIQPSITVNDIQIVDSLNPSILKQNL